MPQLIRLITLSHIYSAANNKVGRETERGREETTHLLIKLAFEQLVERDIKAHTDFLSKIIKEKWGRCWFFVLFSFQSPHMSTV